MNYYERIQNSIDYIEENIEEELKTEECAKVAFMSLSGYYRIFLSIVGYNVKEYIRLRRLSLAIEDIMHYKNASIMTIAAKYYYNSADSFTRAFKKQFGVLPSQVRADASKFPLYKFERIDIMDKIFELGDKELLDKYPDIKIMKELDDMKVACYTYFGPDPETHAFDVVKEWVKDNKISLNDPAYRIFGYNNPDPSDVDDPSELYGYEVCVTIPDAVYEKLEDIPADFSKGSYDGIKRKVLKGGKYAVLSVKKDANGDIGNNIMLAWKRFTKWLDEGKYIWGGRQYLEEHLGFDELDDHIGGVELYLPIELAPTVPIGEKKEITIKKCNVAMFRTEGMDGQQIAQECWDKAFTWASKNNLDAKECQVYQYNKGFDRRPPFFHVIMITLPDGFDKEQCCNDGGVEFSEFAGGKYIATDTDIEHLGNMWAHMEQWRMQNKLKMGKNQWVENWVLDKWEFPYKKIVVCYPIK